MTNTKKYMIGLSVLFAVVVLVALHMDLLDEKCVGVFETHKHEDASTIACELYGKLLSRYII